MPAIIGRIVAAPSTIAKFLLLQLVPALQLTWTIKTGTTPIEGVKVWLSSADPATPQNLITDSIQDTNASGIVQYTLSPDVVYRGWRLSDRYTFDDPNVFRFSTANARWERLVDGTYVEWSP